MLLLNIKEVPNLTNLGVAIKKLKWQRVKTRNERGYYLCLRKIGTVAAQ